MSQARAPGPTVKSEACVGDELRGRWRTPSVAGARAFDAALTALFGEQSAPGYLQTPVGARDLENHRRARLSQDRCEYVPWLNDAGPLEGARVLEIGVGTGSSTLALAEQGAEVVGVDISGPALAVARARLDAYGLGAELVCGNAVDVPGLFAGRRFDWIIFWASLEHMLHAERLAAMTSTWGMLRGSSGGGEGGDRWCVIEAPNRLWYKDTHTAELPFFHWLPDDLAFAYARMSKRAGFGEMYTEATEEAMTAFLRRGRGVSFHEFDLAMGRSAGLQVVSSRSSFERSRFTPEQALTHAGSSTERFATQLAAMAVSAGGPMHEGWFQPWLDLVIRKR